MSSSSYPSRSTPSQSAYSRSTSSRPTPSRAHITEIDSDDDDDDDSSDKGEYFDAYMKKLESEGICRSHLGYILDLGHFYTCPDEDISESLTDLRVYIYEIGQLFASKRKNWIGKFPPFTVHIMLQLLLKIVNTEMQTMAKEEQEQVRYRNMTSQNSRDMESNIQPASPDEEELEMRANLKKAREIRRRHKAAAKARRDIEKYKSVIDLPDIKYENLPPEGVPAVRTAIIFYQKRKDRREKDKQRIRREAEAKQKLLQNIEKIEEKNISVSTSSSPPKKKKKSTKIKEEPVVEESLSLENVEVTSPVKTKKVKKTPDAPKKKKKTVEKEVSVEKEPLIIEDEPLIIEDEPLIIDDEPLIIDDEPLIIDDEPAPPPKKKKVKKAKTEE